jgi:ubiquinone/menaquinone biosynthesis C-methylase UbiE
VLASILELPLADKSIDAGVSLHTIYHIDKDLQEAAVRQLLRVMKPGSPLVVIYANPQRIFSRLKRLITRRKPDPHAGPIYYFAHPTDWWQRFSDTASVEIYPWRSLAAQDSRFIIPNNFLGRWMLALIFRWERAFPVWALNWGAYPMIVLKRKAL